MALIRSAAIILLAATLGVPPCLARNDYGTFYVEGRYLYDPCGTRVIICGANAMIVFWDRGGEKNYPELAQTGANCCRIFWKTGHTPEPVIPAADLDETLTNCWANKMIPMPSLWDATGKWENLDTCMGYWLRDDVLSVLKKHQKHLLLNIANEAGNTVMDGYVEKYVSLVKKLRDAGLHCPIVIDADRWGREWQTVVSKGPSILEQDPDKNLIFSWHNWDPYHYRNGTKAGIKEAVDQSIEKNICFIFGEFGPSEGCGNPERKRIEWEYMIEYADKNDIGRLAWVWRWKDCHAIVPMENYAYGSWNNSWGEGVAVSNPYSIQNTAKRTPYIENGVCDGSVGVRAPEGQGGAENKVPPLNDAAASGRGSMPRVFDIRGRCISVLHTAKGHSGGGIVLLRTESRSTTTTVKARALIR